jgi:hypothetical protein
MQNVPDASHIPNKLSRKAIPTPERTTCPVDEAPGAAVSHHPLRGEKSAAVHDQLVVSPRRARYMLDCGNTRLYELLKLKELESYLDGRSRKITVASIHQLIARRLALARGLSQAPPR